MNAVVPTRSSEPAHATVASPARAQYAAQPSSWPAELELWFALSAGKTRLVRRRHLGPLVVQRPFHPEKDGTCHVYLLHPPGGVAGGDRLDLRFHLDIPGGRPAASYVLGLAFGFGWTPCIGPILGAILTASAASATVGQGVALLAIYSAGLGVPFLVVAGFIDRLAGRLRGAGRIGRRLHQGAGAVMVLMGVAMTTGQLSAMSYWLLDAFPALGRIG
mgnify:CR=1 FL=1